MGINAETARFLCEARREGVPFREVLTLGRQNLNTGTEALTSLASRTGVDPSAALSCAGDYADGFFKRFLGTERLDAIDNSDFEGASLTHDLNVPVPAGWEQQYDAVIDGGTLEHIFNFPSALANCMRMVKTGGRLFIFTPANNQLGHGFYQFSPELFFRTLSPDRGFEVERIVAVQFRYAGTEHGALSDSYRVEDPASVGSRITLVNSHPVTLMIQAVKNEHRSDPFASFPQQSDYTKIWDAGDQDAAPPERAASSLLRAPARLAKKILPRGVEQRLRNEYDRVFVHSFRNKTFYKRVES
jgi:SAM-dependent methyltransferase